MKTCRTSIPSLLITFTLLLFYTGCASMDSLPRSNLLSSAGFVAKTPKTDAQKEAFNDLPSDKMLTGVINGQRLYGYKDQNMVYVGNGQQYQTYKQLAAKQNLTGESVTATEMDPESIKKYRALVPYGYWR